MFQVYNIVIHNFWSYTLFVDIKFDCIPCAVQYVLVAYLYLYIVVCTC